MFVFLKVIFIAKSINLTINRKKHKESKEKWK